MYSTENLINELGKLDISKVEMQFAGGGDSGQIYKILLTDKQGKKCETPVGNFITTVGVPLPKYIDEWFYDFMDKMSEINWTNNSGGEGELTISLDGKNEGIEYEISNYDTEYNSERKYIDMESILDGEC